MTYQNARRRFLITIAISMTVFLLASIALGWAAKSAFLPNYVLWILVLVPVLALLAPLRAQWRYLGELDEYLRNLEVRAIFASLAVLLILASGWGYVELYLDAPSLPLYWLNPVYWVAYSVGSMFVAMREARAA